MRGKSNPNYRHLAGTICVSCGARFVSYNKDRRYCGWDCYKAARLSPSAGRSGIDSNQAEIVSALRSVGVAVVIATRIGRGFPDLICAHAGVTKLLEVKNPTNRYGRSGFTKSQQEWAATWPGEIHIVRSIEDAFSAMGVPGCVKDAMR